ncbi:MFS transporter [Bacteroides heparinolyticus]|uniref:MFS transporter n=1 Tax=Prevotella heparinolytica TaxID=28113 RepID=UPI0035A0E422
MDRTTEQPRLWTGSFIRICLVNFFIFVNFHALLPTFPFFISYLGGDAVTIGLATALFSIASIVSRPFVGWLVDTRGRFTILVLGLVGMALIPMGYFVSAGIALAVLLRTAHGIFHAASSNASSTWVTDIIPHSRMGEGLGMYGLSMAISTAVAPALGLAVMGEWGFCPLFAIAALVALVALLTGAGIRSRTYTMSVAPLRIGALFEPMSLPAAVTQFFFMMAYGVVEVYVAIYAASCHLPGGGIYFIFIALATVGTRILLGHAIDKYGEARLVYSGNAAIMAGILLLVFAHNMPCYLLSAILLGYSFGAIQPSLQTMAMHAVPPERRGAASSTFFVAFDFGIALGGFLAGVLVKYSDYDTMFLCMIVPCVCSWGYYYIFGRRHASSFNPRNRRKPHDTEPIIEDASCTNQALPLVITLSREYGSGGHRIGELLSQKLGIKFYDKELILLTAQKSGMNERLVQESEQTVNSLLMYDDPTQTAVFLSQCQVIRDIADREPCVIVGRLANFILEGRPNCLHLFVYADETSRIRRIVSEYGVEEKHAGSMLKRIDQERREHCLHYTGYEWGDRHHYHLMLDSSMATTDEAVEIIRTVLHNISQGRRR